MNVIVWNIETVPDLRGFAAANGVIGKTEVEVLEAIGDKLSKHIYHSFVCIVALVARKKAESSRTGSAGSRLMPAATRYTILVQATLRLIAMTRSYWRD